MYSDPDRNPGRVFGMWAALDILVLGKQVSKQVCSIASSLLDSEVAQKELGEELGLKFAPERFELVMTFKEIITTNEGLWIVCDFCCTESRAVQGGLSIRSLWMCT